MLSKHKIYFQYKELSSGLENKPSKKDVKKLLRKIELLSFNTNTIFIKKLNPSFLSSELSLYFAFGF